MKLIMTPGPTSVSENVRQARALPCTNPDLDIKFYDFYKNCCNKIGNLLNTKNDVRILSGEGILGLEGACASLTEKGDRVLVIDNGIFGEGFGGFVTMYGGEAVYFKGDRKHGINLEDLKDFLKEDNEFKYATIVHCDTPSGILNNIEGICELLNEYGILSVVDAVSSIGGHEIFVDKWGVDICLGASQKVLSAPPGLTFLSVSERAWEVMEDRKTPITGYYCNLTIWKDYYKKKWFPYTMPISDIYGLDAALDNLDNSYEIHRKYGEAFRTAILSGGLTLYTKDSYSNTVSVIEVPKGTTFKEINSILLDEHNVMIAGAFDYLDGKVFRVGHMGNGCDSEKLSLVLKAIEDTLIKLGVEVKKGMVEVFKENL